MKILLLSNTNNIKNGYGNLTHQFCLYLKSKGVDFTLLLPRGEKRYDYANYTIEYVLPPYIFDLKTKKVWEYLTFSYSTDADIIHSITEFPYAVLAARIAKKTGKPLIIQSAGTYGVKPLLYFPDKIILKWAYNAARLITPISVYTRDMIKKLSGTQTPFKIIHPGVDFKRFDVNVDTTALRQKYPHKKILLTVGVMKPRKGHDVVLKALGMLKKEREDFHYVVVGSFDEGRDVYYESLKKLVQENNLLENVTFTGEVGNEDLVAYFHACDIYIHTPRVIHMNFEGFGMVYLEAGVCRKPVVAADSGGTSDAVIPNETGLVVPENDPTATAAAIKKLLDDPLLCQKMGTAGYEYAKKHTWDTIGDEYMAVYRELLS
jgi:glycosyltransferase involved in cell wall biosynthesis